MHLLTHFLFQEIDLGRLASETDDKIEELRLRWFGKFEKTDTEEPQNRFRIGLLKVGYGYARLVALAFGFQHAFGKGSADENPFLNRVRTSPVLVYSAVLTIFPRPTVHPRCIGRG